MVWGKIFAGENKLAGKIVKLHIGEEISRPFGIWPAYVGPPFPLPRSADEERGTLLALRSYLAEGPEGACGATPPTTLGLSFI